MLRAIGLETSFSSFVLAFLVRCGVVSGLFRSFEPICGFQRSVERIGARELDVQDSVERGRLDGIRISVVCAERIQKRLYQSGREGRRCVAEGEKLEQRRSLLQGVRT